MTQRALEHVLLSVVATLLDSNVCRVEATEMLRYTLNDLPDAVDNKHFYTSVAQCSGCTQFADTSMSL